MVGRFVPAADLTWAVLVAATVGMLALDGGGAEAVPWILWIAVIKGVLITAFFMELFQASKTTLAVFAAFFVILGAVLVAGLGGHLSVLAG